MSNYEKLKKFERRSLLKYLGVGSLGALATIPFHKAFAQVTTSITNQKITCEEIDFQTLTHPTISNTEFGYLNGVSSSIQDQLNAKASTTHKDTHKSGGSDEITSSDLLEAVVKRLRESSGPTDLTLGSIADGEYLKRSGSTVIGGTPAGGGGGYITITLDQPERSQKSTTNTSFQIAKWVTGNVDTNINLPSICALETITSAKIYYSWRQHTSNATYAVESYPYVQVASSLGDDFKEGDTYNSGSPLNTNEDDGNSWDSQVNDVVTLDVADISSGKCSINCQVKHRTTDGSATSYIMPGHFVLILAY